MWLQVIAAVVGTSVIAVALGAIGRRYAARRAAAWEEAAGQLGLRFEVTVDHEPLMRGEVRGYPVRVFEERDEVPYSNKETRFTTVEVGPIGWLPRTALIGRPRSIRVRGRSLDRVLSGDARFDAVVHVRGPTTELLPLLDYDARRALLLAFDVGELRIESGRLTLRSLGYLFDPVKLAGLVGKASAVVAGLDPEGRSMVEQLTKTVRREPVADAREVALAELARCHREEPATRELAAELSGSGRPARRVMALDLLGAAGVPVAEGVVRDPNTDDETRARARAFLEQHGREVGWEQVGRLSVLEDADPDAAGRLSHAAQQGELALAED